MSDENKQSTEQTAPNQQPPQSTPPSSQLPKNNTVMGVLAYIGPLVIISYLVAKDDPFVKFHIKQGLVLLCIEIIIGLAGSMIWMLWPILQIIHFIAIVLSIIGIINVVNGKQKEIPIVGQFSKYFDKV